MGIYQLGTAVPSIAASAYVADTSAIIGNVTVLDGASIWFGATIRGDNDGITIGANSNIQEGAVLHTDPGYSLTVEPNVTIGHQAMLHGCSVGEGTTIGMQAVILNGARIGKNCLVGAGALITEGKVFPDNSLIIGMPAKVSRTLTEEEIAGMRRNTAGYVERAQSFKTLLNRIS